MDIEYGPMPVFGTLEYTEMVENLEDAFGKAITRYILPDESDDEINIEYSGAPGNERKKPRLSGSRDVKKTKKVSRPPPTPSVSPF